MRHRIRPNHFSPPLNQFQPKPCDPCQKPLRPLHGPNMTNETSNQTTHPSRESRAEESKAMTLWTAEIEHTEGCRVIEHEEELFDNKTSDNYALHEKPSISPINDYMTRSQVEKLKEDHINFAVEVSSRRLVTRVVEWTIEDAFTVSFDEQKKESGQEPETWLKAFWLTSSNHVA